MPTFAQYAFYYLRYSQLMIILNSSVYGTCSAAVRESSLVALGFRVAGMCKPT